MSSKSMATWRRDIARGGPPAQSEQAGAGTDNHTVVSRPPGKATRDRANGLLEAARAAIQEQDLGMFVAGDTRRFVLGPPLPGDASRELIDQAVACAVLAQALAADPEGTRITAWNRQASTIRGNSSLLLGVNSSLDIVRQTVVDTGVAAPTDIAAVLTASPLTPASPSADIAAALRVIWLVPSWARELPSLTARAEVTALEAARTAALLRLEEGGFRSRLASRAPDVVQLLATPIEATASQEDLDRVRSAMMMAGEICDGPATRSKVFQRLHKVSEVLGQPDDLSVLTGKVSSARSQLQRSKLDTKKPAYQWALRVLSRESPVHDDRLAILEAMTAVGWVYRLTTAAVKDAA